MATEIKQQHFASIISCEKKVLAEVGIGHNISSWDLTKMVKQLYYHENDKRTHVYTETLIKNIRKFRQTGEFNFICVDHNRSIYQRLE